MYILHLALKPSNDVVIHRRKGLDKAMLRPVCLSRFLILSCSLDGSMRASPASRRKALIMCVGATKQNEIHDTFVAITSATRLGANILR